MIGQLRLVSTIAAVIAWSIGGGIACAHEICGEPPPTQFQVRNDESLKGDIEGKAQLLTKFVGDAQLGGKVETSRREIFAKYPDANKARTDAYFAYMFCVLLFSPDNPQSFAEKQQALTHFHEHLAQTPESGGGNQTPAPTSGVESSNPTTRRENQIVDQGEISEGRLPGAPSNTGLSPSLGTGNLAVVGEARDVTINQSQGKTADVKLEGLIMPANEPDLPSPCSRDFPSGTLKIFVGSNLFWLTKQAYHLPIVRIAGRDLLWIDRSPDGVFVSADIIREDGRLVTTIRNNQFVINPNNYFENRSRDRHELSIAGKDGLALRVRYLNENALVVEGTFVLPGHAAVKATPDSLQNGVMRTEKVCFRADEAKGILDLDANLDANSD